MWSLVYRTTRKNYASFEIIGVCGIGTSLYHPTPTLNQKDKNYMDAVMEDRDPSSSWAPTLLKTADCV